MKSGPLPPNGAEWMPLDTAYRLGYAHTGSVEFTVTDLQNALEAGSVRAKIRLRGGNGKDEQRALDPEFWRTSFGLKAKWSQASVDAAPVVIGLRLARRGKQIIRDYGVVYVWEPDIQKLWPTSKAASPKPQPAQSGGRKGRLPEYDWPVIDREITRRMMRDGKLVEPRSTNKLATDVLEWASLKWREVPSETSMREHVNNVLNILRQLKN
jgi:hypothetical protein